MCNPFTVHFLAHNIFLYTVYNGLITFTFIDLFLYIVVYFYFFIILHTSTACYLCDVFCCFNNANLFLILSYLCTPSSIPLARALMATIRPDTMAWVWRLSARATESELHLLLNIGQRHLFHRPPTCFICRGFIRSFLKFCSSSYVLPSSFNLIAFCFTHSIYFLADTILCYINISLL